jgi:iron-sulfur cluster repair protein YtfE (RIC family)
MAIPTEPLRSEHRELLPHLDELRVLADGIGRWSTHWTDRVAGTVTFLRQDLVPHARAEEAVLYPEVERLLGAPGATATMAADHIDIVARIDQLDRSVTTLGSDAPDEAKANELRAQLYGLWAILLLHFRKEEEVLLPVVDAKVNADQASVLFARMGAVAHGTAPAP